MTTGILSNSFPAVRLAYAEDERCTRTCVTSMLRKLGIDVIVEAEHGQELIEKSEAGLVKPDVYLTDLNMPVMDGIKTITEIKLRWPEAKVAVLSSDTHESLISQARQVGASAYLEKSCSIEQIRDMIIEMHQMGYTNLGYITP